MSATMKTIAWRVLGARGYWLGLASLGLLVWLAVSGLAPSLSVLEAVWLWTILAGMRFASANLRGAKGDRDYIAARRLNGGRRIVARNGVRREQMRILKQCALLVLGLYAATPPEARPPWLASLPAACIIVTGVTMTVGSFLDARERAALLVLLGAVDRHEPRGEQAEAGA